jgi:Membrane domain of glycerophosphoryl diester phosphodiesterase
VITSVVREVWRLFLARFWRTLVIVLLLLAPLELLVALVDPDFSSFAYGWWAWVGISAAVTLVAFPWVIGAVVHDVGRDDRAPTDAYRRTASRLPDLVISAVVTTVAILLGTIALVVPGLLLMARWALIVPLIVLDGTPWRAALARSNELVRGRTWSVVGIFVVLTVIGAALVALPVLAGYFVLEGVIGAWLATLAIDTVGIAFYSFAPFVLYRRLAA